MNPDHDSNTFALKVTLVWLSAWLGSITLNQWVLLATLVYTVVQTFLAIERRIRKGVKNDSD